jgi:hypothetical protein
MTQHVTKADEWNWRMYEEPHRLSWSPDDGSATLEIRKCSEGILEIYVSEEGKRAKDVLITLKPDTVKSLLDWFRACAQEPAANGSNQQASAATNSPSKSRTTSAAP